MDSSKVRFLGSGLTSFPVLVRVAWVNLFPEMGALGMMLSLYLISFDALEDWPLEIDFELLALS